MAKKASAAVPEVHPEISKSDAIRTVFGKLPDASASAVVDQVKQDCGLTVSQPLVYQVKGKLAGKTPATTKRVAKPQRGASGGPESVVETIEAGRRLLTLTGSVESATAVLRAL